MKSDAATLAARLQVIEERARTLNITAGVIHDRIARGLPLSLELLIAHDLDSRELLRMSRKALDASIRLHEAIPAHPERRLPHGETISPGEQQ